MKIATVKISDHRTYHFAAKKYKLYVNSPVDYDNVYIQYFAGREDDKQDELIVNNIKMDGIPRIDVHSKKIGPISLKTGKNVMYIEFEDEGEEGIGVIPVFTMEVPNEK